MVEWKEAIICPIYNKRDKLDCKFYRAITILNGFYKILFLILFCLLSPVVSRFAGFQADFMLSCLTTDQIFVWRQILQKCRKYQVPTYHSFVGFNDAYDSIDRRKL